MAALAMGRRLAIVPPGAILRSPGALSSRPPVRAGAPAPGPSGGPAFASVLTRAPGARPFVATGGTTAMSRPAPGIFTPARLARPLAMVPARPRRLLTPALFAPRPLAIFTAEPDDSWP